jgi:hypothetical protein
MNAKRIPCRLALLLLVVLAPGACSQHAFLDDLPPYPPTEPFLEEQEARRLRLQANHAEKERLRNRYLSEAREKSFLEWQRLDGLREQALRRLEADRARRAPRVRRVNAERLEEWERIVR